MKTKERKAGRQNGVSQVKEGNRHSKAPWKENRRSGKTRSKEGEKKRLHYRPGSSSEGTGQQLHPEEQQPPSEKCSLTTTQAIRNYYRTRDRGLK